MFHHQLPRQAPAHADIAEIVDNLAENIPAFWQSGHCSFPHGLKKAGMVEAGHTQQNKAGNAKIRHAR
jgi:hypothetical protein